MIDTIRLKINDIFGKNSPLYKECKNQAAGFQAYNYDPKKKKVKEILTWKPNGSLSDKFIQHNQYLPSSNYKIQINFNSEMNYANLEFSLPKFFYGNNVLQLINGYENKDFYHLKGYNDQFLYQAKHMYSLFIKSIERFFISQFPMVHIDYTEIELTRIDLCYNLIFENEKDKYLYFQAMKRLKKKYTRDEKIKLYGEETISFQGDDMMFKVYDKGKEFEKNDLKELQNLGYSEKTLNYLKNLSKRILRYECTYRKRKISYIYNKTIFRKNSKKDILQREIYKQLNNIDRKLLWTDKKELHQIYKSIPNNIRDEYKTELDIEIETESQMIQFIKKIYKQFKNIYEHEREFKIKSLIKREIYLDENNLNLNLVTFKERIFSENLLYMMAKHFLEQIKDIQPQVNDTTEVYLQRINKYNEELYLKKKLDKQYNIENDKQYLQPNIYKMLIIALSKKTLKEIKKECNIPDSTYYRYLYNLKNKIGWNPNQTLDLEIPKVNIDYEKYLEEYNNNYNTIRKLFSMNINDLHKPRLKYFEVQ